MGIPFCKIQGFLYLSPCYVTNREFPFETSVVTVEYCGSDIPSKLLFIYFFLLESLLYTLKNVIG